MVSQCLRRLFAPWCPVSRGNGYEAACSSRVFCSSDTFRAIEPRQTTTSETLNQLTTVNNVRDLGEACRGIAPGRIFRSACPLGAPVEDVQLITDRLRVRQMVDLRSDYERKQDLPIQNGLFGEARVIQHSRKGNTLLNQVVESGSFDDSTKVGLKVDLLSFLERDRYYRAMLTRVPYLTAASVLFWGLFNQSRAKTLAIREINAAGLPGLYKTILATAGPEIRKALEIILESAEQNIPVLFFCKVGKDRTGLLASVVLACCGASPEEIISDYARSDGVDQIALGSMEKDKELKELDAAMFSRAPADVMQTTLEHFDDEYGGVRGYMEQIGFSASQQTRLAQCLSPEAPP